MKPSLFNRKKNTKFKYTLQIKQTDASLYIAGQLSKEDYQVRELWLFSRKSREAFQISTTNEHTKNHFSFEVNLRHLMKQIQDCEEEFYDWYLKIDTPYDNLAESKKEDDTLDVFEVDNTLYATYFIRLGRFQQTEIERMHYYYDQEDRFLLNYITDKGNISLLKNKEMEATTKVQIDTFKRDKNLLKLEGKIFTKNAFIDDIELSLRGRNAPIECTSKNIELIPMKADIERKFGLKRYLYKVNIDLSELNKAQQEEHDTYDAFFKVNMHDRLEPLDIRIGRPTFRARLGLKNLFIKGQKQVLVINPYYTFKQLNLSLEAYQFSTDTFAYLRKKMRWAWFNRIANRNKNVWLVGERIYKAQDTGLAFFRYMRENYPNKNVYYVIEKDSPERKNVEKYGNVVDFKSKEHIELAIIAKKIISSHHPDYLYPIRTDAFKAKVKADKVFLQHGVMGTKNMVANYGKDAPGFDTDLFMVSSDFEKQMIVSDFGYRPEQVFVTGLSRFDLLFEKDIPLKRQILIIPTWRDWIGSDEALLESEYYSRYQQLINAPELHTLAARWNFELIFCLHPNMQKFTKYFENDCVRIISQGEVNVQDLIKESALMITDYSSVGFDFSFLHKPVIYYQFDRGRFIGNLGSHLELDDDLPGEITREQLEILELIDTYAAHDFQMKPIYVERSNKFLTYRDQNACERIYNVVRHAKVKHRIMDKPKLALLSKAIFNRYRKSKYYYPSMKLFYNIGRRIIPVDPNLIVFESGVGKQFSDSPRKIYEEIVAQGLNYKKVWFYNKQQRFLDAHTIRVKRLSPKYYYYLLKARFWVNNQNFPTYIRKRKETTYLQTWHGTPLKKMLYDIEQVHGRKDGYVERVGESVKNWDYLVSPSQYATKAFRSAFHYDGEMLEVGYPRNDIFYLDKRHAVIQGVKNKLDLDPTKKIIVYAPTFRDDQTNKKNKFSFELNMDLYKMQEALGDEYTILLRMHVVVSSKLRIDEELQDFVKNVSSYPDMQELLLIADILITDYSSVMFDFANTKRPMLFYTYDFEHYRDDLRGFYMDFAAEAPGPLVYQTEEIIDSILNIENVQTSYAEKYQNFRNKYCYLDDGDATKRVVNKLFH